MTTQVNEIYVLTEEEKNFRNAVSFLKGCGVGYVIKKGGKYKSTKEYSEHFKKGLDFGNPKEVTVINRWNQSHTYTPYRHSEWMTVCHIIHNRLRHNRPHMSSWESDQQFLVDSKEDVDKFKEALVEYHIHIPGLQESE